MRQLWRVLFTKTSGFFTTGNQVHVLAILCFSHKMPTLRPTYWLPAFHFNFSLRSQPPQQTINLQFVFKRMLLLDFEFCRPA